MLGKLALKRGALIVAVRSPEACRPIVRESGLIVAVSRFQVTPRRLSLSHLPTVSPKPSCDRLGLGRPSRLAAARVRSAADRRRRFAPGQAGLERGVQQRSGELVERAEAGAGELAEA